ncbi:nucleotidyl transferase AbiEii/AbiGii toxin family protein [bacterium]|nr:nucleotidyl transferase AbiEii/AbiGii toxin family protein [bacterium]
MIGKSLNLSGKIDQSIVEALLVFNSALESLGIPFFLVGAGARDLIFKYYGIKSSRKTEDVDLGIQIASWEEFNSIRDKLLESGFAPTKIKYRFEFKELLIDIVPFGGLADKDAKITWPIEDKLIMSVAGFDEAYQSSVPVKISENPDLKINVSSLTGLAIMKIIAWNEKYPERPKDGEDLFLIMENYEDADNFERLYDKEQLLLKEEDYDTQLAAIRLLGRDMADVAEPKTFDLLKAILQDERNQDKLVQDVIRQRSLPYERRGEVLAKFLKLIQGFEDKTPE